MTNAVFMPYVLAYNRPAIEERINRLTGYLSIADGFEGFMSAILDLRAAIGVPHRLAQLGVDKTRRDDIATMAIVDPTAAGNPVELTAEAAKTIFDCAFSGIVRLNWHEPGRCIP